MKLWVPCEGRSGGRGIVTEHFKDKGKKKKKMLTELSAISGGRAQLAVCAELQARAIYV